MGLVLIRKVLGFKFAYVPRGPLMDYEDAEVVKAMLEGLTKLAKKQRCLFIRLDPNVNYRVFPLADKDTSDVLPSGQKAIDNLLLANSRHMGFPLKMGDGFQPRFMAIAHYSEDYMDKLSKKAKKSIKDADKLMVKVRKASVDDLDDFINVIHKTENRKDIQLRSKSYFELMMKTLKEKALLMYAEIYVKENIQIYTQELNQLLAELPEKPPKRAALMQQRIDALKRNIDELQPYLESGQDKIVLSGGLSIMYGHTIEHIYSGFNIDFKRYRPQYKLTTERMRYGFERGYTYSNFGGIEGSLDDGLTEFKSNFNPLIHEYIGEFDVPTSWLYPLFMIAWKLRKKLRG